jgi:hypothetical protein
MTVVMPDGRRPLPRTAVGRPEIVHTPGMTDDLMREFAPVLVEDGIDRNDPRLDSRHERAPAGARPGDRASQHGALCHDPRWSLVRSGTTLYCTTNDDTPFDKHRTRIHVHRTVIGMPERSGSRSASGEISCCAQGRRSQYCFRAGMA